MITINMMRSIKRCGTCKQYKFLTEFHRDQSHSDGYRSKCKQCSNNYCSQWNQNAKLNPKTNPELPVDFVQKCYVCKQMKDEKEFSKNKTRASGLNTRCRVCDSDYHKKRKQDNPEYMRKLINEAARQYRANNKQKLRIRWRIESRIARLKRYNITEMEFMERLKAQNFQCAICKTNNPGGSGTWHIDHDHQCCGDGSFSCGKCIRGLLCVSCNHGLGNFRDNLNTIRLAADYLENYQSYKKRPDLDL